MNLPVPVLHALLVLEHDYYALADLAFHDLGALFLAMRGAASGAIVRRDLCGPLAESKT